MAPRLAPLVPPELRTVRQLPITLAPMQYETALSFIKRLAAANCLTLSALLAQISPLPVLRDRNPPGADLALTETAWSVLAVMVGRDPTALRSAIPPFTVHRPRPPAEPRVTMVTSGAVRRIFPACETCRLERGIITDSVEIRPPAFLHLCRRHQVWLRDAAIDVAATPELIRAQHRHRRLAAAHPAEHLAAAQTSAGNIIAGWRQSPFHPLAVRFRVRADLIESQNPDILLPNAATSYPELVHLTAMIASAHWSRLATGDRHDQERFLREANLRLHCDGLHAADADDPLLAWIRALNGHRGKVILDPRDASPLLKSTPLRLADWEQPPPPPPPRRRRREHMSKKYKRSLKPQSDPAEPPP
ncbi:hypothetical protein ABH926_008818 [Catenulispora sp. GP43]|uniref:hypothetical protein n=1 Tax=Catenulispora sp. GP43 TaxID=3156263 RepID=UPI003514709B